MSSINIIHNISSQLNVQTVLLERPRDTQWSERIDSGHHVLRMYAKRSWIDIQHQLNASASGAVWSMPVGARRLHQSGCSHTDARWLLHKRAVHAAWPMHFTSSRIRMSLHHTVWWQKLWGRHWATVSIGTMQKWCHMHRGQSRWIYVPMCARLHRCPLRNRNQCASVVRVRTMHEQWHLQSANEFE